VLAWESRVAAWVAESHIRLGKSRQSHSRKRAKTEYVGGSLALPGLTAIRENKQADKEKILMLHTAT
jgi:hypothetical protein